MNERSKRIGLGLYIVAIALLPVVSIATTMFVLLISVNHLDGLREKQRARRAAVYKVSRILPQSLSVSLLSAVQLNKPTRLSAEEMGKYRSLSTEAVDSVESATDSARAKDLARRLALSCAEFHSATLQLIWLDTIGANEIAPLEYALLQRQASESVGYTPTLMKELLQCLNEEIANDRQSMQLQHSLRWIAIAGLAVTMLLSVGFVFLFSKQVNRRLAILTKNARDLSVGEPLAAPLSGDDQIASLDRNLHEMAYTLSAARYEEQAAIRNSADIICSLDDAFAVLDVNYACEKILGYSRQDILLHGADKLLMPDLAKSALDQLAAMRTSGEARQFETQLRTVNGDPVDALCSGFYSEQDKFTFCILHDIRRRKEIERLVRDGEAKERLLMERMPAGLLTFDEAGIITGGNIKAAEILKLPELVGRSLAASFGSENVEPGAYVKDLRSKTANQICTIAVERDGEQRALEVSLAQLPQQGEKQYLCVVLDQTERQQFKQMRERFLSMIAHDIATPLTCIGGIFTFYAEGLYGQLTENGMRKVQVAQAESQRLGRLFRDLLRAERDSNWQLAIGASTVDLRSVLEQAVAGVAEQAERAQVSINLSAPSCHMRVDPDRMAQVFVNLLTNALKFAPAKSTVDIGVTIHNQFVRIEVEDDGPGVPEEMHEAVFQPFQQVTVEDSTVREGAGLGLAICHQIVASHGGMISSSTRARGACFTIELPIVE